MNLHLAAAKAHHIPPHVANALGWAVVVAIIVVVVIAVLRRLR